MPDLDQLLTNIEQAETASQKRLAWQPDNQGSIDIRIAADGRWYHEGRLFERSSLVKLFASVLRLEEDEYYLVTPVEKLAIEVDDAPFLAPLVERIDHDGEQALVFTTNLDEQIVANEKHPIRVDIDPDTQEPRPYVMVRDNLEALIGRNAFYDLLTFAEPVERNERNLLTIHSMGNEFILGAIDNSE